MSVTIYSVIIMSDNVVIHNVLNDYVNITVYQDSTTMRFGHRRTVCVIINHRKSRDQKELTTIFDHFYNTRDS